ncbi:hypothetical protein ABT095_07900 [Kitasatospora sp. NPDC002227]|uniref:hypothetical protein n=1 Tax=Kitasatospora sp. NPDC002227 TaxID=3154773 RepID=UPI003328B3F5
MTTSTADVITYTLSFTVAAALLAAGVLGLAGLGPGRTVPRAEAVPALLTGGGIALCTLARIPATDRLLGDALLGLPGLLLLAAGAYRYWRTR